MKIKQKPEDFQVHEINEFKPDNAGKFFVYRLTKRGLSTLECLKILTRKHRLKNQDMQLCGLKDKHSFSTQLISSKREIPEDTNNDQFSLEFVGRSNDRVGADNHKGNKFIITVRDLSDSEVEYAQGAIENVQNYGFVNYFDDQRFGSVKHGNAFVAKLLIEKKYEEACKVFMSETSSADRSRDRRRRKDIAANWGNFKHLDEKYGYCEEKPLISHLAKHEKDWVGALLKINHNLRHILLYAYQSFIWNKTVSFYLQNKGFAELASDYLLGQLLFFEKIDDADFSELEKLEVPLIKHNTDIENDEIRMIYDNVLAVEGLTIQQFRIRAHHDLYFKEFQREVVILPEELTIVDAGDDELNEGQKFVTLQFNLPPGVYATILLKRLFKSQKLTS